VMDQFTRRIIGFGVHRGSMDGVALCRMFQRAVGTRSLPKYLSSVRIPGQGEQDSGVNAKNVPG
jgi:hypothetical protein